ncbi:GNAT family N-acetyltransferase [Grimontia marina]|uniref:Putative ribosomal N-acetyltransferase YdaF n=1 Tax=Grimontia marina TaxID=646534 RepID=A0A128F242_9GAMM|nr:GNAT family protein [Grimontia marina]CZF80500.1 Putative ribosomal N-acetyltransferase YdaF [Grimontia marina]
METVSLLPLSLSDCPALLDFERRNKTWFEQFIPPRPSGYFNLAGLTDATRELVENQSTETHLMYVIYDGDKIVARANIHTIYDDHVEIGYRVCQEYLGKGIAKRALLALVEVCREQLDVGYVVGKVTSGNQASIKVLENAGFAYQSKALNATLIQGQHHDLLSYQLIL